MGKLELDEVLDNAGDFLKNLGAAARDDSEGGKTITKKELFDMALQLAKQLSIDVID